MEINGVSEDQVIEFLSRHDDPGKLLAKASVTRGEREKRGKELHCYLDEHPDHPYVW